MIVCHEHEFIYIKAMKVAGTSVFNVLSDFCSDGDHIFQYQTPYKPYELNGYKLNSHCPALAFRMATQDIWPSYSKISVVRNPWDVEVSRYFWYRDQGNIPADATFSDFVERHIRNLSATNDPFYFIDDDMVLDYAIMYENLQQDFDAFCDSKSLPRVELPMTKNTSRTNREHYSKTYEGNQEWIDLVAACHSKTIRHFGYTFQGE